MNEERWASFPLHVQMGHIASEVERAANRLAEGHQELSKASLWEVLKLVELTKLTRGGRSFREAARLYEYVAWLWMSEPCPLEELRALGRYCLAFYLRGAF